MFAQWRIKAGAMNDGLFFNCGSTNRATMKGEKYVADLLG